MSNKPNENDSGTPQDSWTVVAKSDSIKDECAIEVVASGQILAIFRHDGQLHAIDGMCAHQGGPIAKGEVSAGCVTCPWHGWQYELKTGIQTINRQPLQQVFPVRERDGNIEVNFGS